VGARLSERLGQPVVIVNQPGASGNIGADAVAKATDGHTLLMGANTMLMASQMYKNVSFNPIKDFAPISMAAYGTLMLVAHPKTGIKTMAELIAQAKARPGNISFGSPGVGTPHHMAMELFKVQTSLFMLHVPYRGTAGYTQDLLSGELNVGFLPVHIAQGFVRDGKLNSTPDTVVITAVVPTPNNRAPVGMIGAAELALMKPSAVLINNARGTVVDLVFPDPDLKPSDGTQA
jgi:tripartite-type tricarboxylate transporter receptor subunit TctC